MNDDRLSITGRWEIEICRACGWQVDDCDECGCADDEAQEGTREGIEVVPASQLAGAVDAETLERYRWALDEAVRFLTDRRGNPDAIKALLVLAEWGQSS